NEDWPRIVSTRRIVKDGSRYFGPYTSASAAYDTINLLNRLFPYRKCDKTITGNESVCLYYHMHQCTAPCIGAVDRESYMQAIEGARLFLEGPGDEIITTLEDEMDQASEAWNFERAAELRDRLQAVRHVLERQKIVSNPGTNADIVAVAKGAGGDAGVQVGFLRNGKIIGSDFFQMRAAIDDEPSEIISSFLTQFYNDAAMIPSLILLQHPLPEGEVEMIRAWMEHRSEGSVELRVPQRGQKRHLVTMIAESASENLEQSRLKFLSDEQKMTAAMTGLAEALDLPRLPRRIECYDISNLQGTNPVASMVVFEDGKPAKKEYRRFAIKTVAGANDFAMMAEVITRRFKRAANQDEEQDGKWTRLPDLVIIDGGKGQLSSAYGALKSVGMEEVPLAALAKEQEELFLPGNPVSILLPRDSQALFLVQRIRDEAHRFAVTFHRTRRSKSSFASQLDDIPGVGPKRKKALIRKFGSVKGIREASAEELTTVDGINLQLAENIKASL
ncbi:MAG: excinuclease ABC subunit UvrC, partial [Chloroflexota bacterium]|nr:excinuclease ABC subunit UvrC [Chloroflexota bacterium]